MTVNVYVHVSVFSHMLRKVRRQLVVYHNRYLALGRRVIGDCVRKVSGMCSIHVAFLSKVYSQYSIFCRQDEKVNNLVAICFSVNCFPTISAWEHTFAPREYLVSNLEDLFMKYVFVSLEALCVVNNYVIHFRHVVGMMHYNHETQDIARPSEVLARVQSYMASLRTLELYVNIDMTRVLTAVLLQETQSLDSKGESTVASTYTSWYVGTCLL